MSSLEPNLFSESKEAQFASLASFAEALAQTLVDIKIRIGTVAYSSSFPANR